MQKVKRKKLTLAERRTDLKNQCPSLAPDHFYKAPHGECILKENHGGVGVGHNDVHLSKTKNGDYVVWAYDDDSEPEDDDIVWNEISAKDVKKMTSKGLWIDEKSAGKLL